MTSLARTINFTARDGSPITLTRTARGETETFTLDYAITKRRLSRRRGDFDRAVCTSRRVATRVGTLCRIMDPDSEYWVEEYPGWGWVVKQRNWMNTVGTVTSLGVLGDSIRRSRLLSVAEVSRLTESEDATFTY